MDTKSLMAGLLGGAAVTNKVGDVIKGFFTGIFLVIIAFAIVFWSVNGVRETSAELEALPLTPVEDLSEQRGMVKTFGTFETENPVALSVLGCEDRDCRETTEAFGRNDLFYYRVEFQRFEVVRETEKDEDGKEVTTYEHEWVSQSEESSWSDLILSGVEVDPDDARAIIDFEREEIEDVYIENLGTLQTYGEREAADEPDFGTTRALISFLPVNDAEFTVVGELRSDGISTGDPFIITDDSADELVTRLGGEENALRWGVRIFAFFLFTAGFTAMLGPVLMFTDFIPVVGGAARALAGGISALLAFILVLTTIFFVKFWWVLLLLMVVLIAGFTFFAIQGKKEGTETKA